MLRAVQGPAARTAHPGWKRAGPTPPSPEQGSLRGGRERGSPRAYSRTEYVWLGLSEARMCEARQPRER